MDHLDVFCVEVKLAVDLVSGDTECRANNFNAEQYWGNLENVLETLHKEVTKVSVLYASPPVPVGDSAEKLFHPLTNCVLMLTSARFGLPAEQGVLLGKVIKDYFIGLLSCLSDFAESLKQGSEERLLMETGKIWEACADIHRLPRDNKLCVLRASSDTLALVTDALDELLQARDVLQSTGDDINNTDELSKAILIRGIGLVKTAKVLATKVKNGLQTNASTQCAQHIAELDTMYGLLQQISPQVDDFSAALYPPVDRQEVITTIHPLVQSLENVITFYREHHLMHANDQGWVEMLHNAISHNEKKILEEIT